MLLVPETAAGATLTETEFTEHLATVSPALRAYVCSLMPNGNTAVDDVIQETSVYLWENRSRYVSGTSFRAWAFKTAYFKVLSRCRDQQRDQIVTFSEETVAQIAQAAAQETESFDERLQALRLCLRQIGSENVELLSKTYVDQTPLSNQASARGVPVSRLHKTLSRLRKKLRQCVDSQTSR